MTTTASDIRPGAAVGADPHDVAIGHFSRLRRQNTQMLETFASRWSVASSDVRALYFLAQHGDATPKRVAEFLALTTGAMTSLLDRIERAGLAHRVAHPTDRRSVVIEMTPQGRAAIGEALDVYRVAFASAIPDADLEATGELFARLAEAFELQTLLMVRGA